MILKRKYAGELKPKESCDVSASSKCTASHGPVWRVMCQGEDTDASHGNLSNTGVALLVELNINM